jgi:hypothetical protein
VGKLDVPGARCAHGENERMRRLYTLQVNDYVLSHPIHADLVCSDEMTPEVKSTATEEVKSPVGESAASPQSGIENRLNELEDLYEKGVITREEYSETRERILNEI